MIRGLKWLPRVLAGVTVEEMQRFHGTFDVTQTALDRRAGADTEPWGSAARQDIDNARARADKFKLEAAWTALKSAQREMTRSFDASELVAEARIVRNEADDKLSGWREKSVADLLPAELLDSVALAGGGLTVERTARVQVGDAPAANETSRPLDRIEESLPAPTEGDDIDSASRPIDGAESLVGDLRARLIDAKWVLDTDSDNVYHKYRILRRAVISNTVVYGLILAALVAIVALEWVPNALLPDQPENSPLGSWRLLLVVMTLGMIGAFFSSATELRNPGDKTRIPDLRVRYTLMGMRPVVGAAGAVVVIVVLQSALGEAVTLESAAIFGVAIAAGFTERLVTKTVSSAANAIG